MSVLKNYNEIVTDLDNYMIELLDNSEYPKQLVDPIKYIFIGKGKRIRAILLVEVCELFELSYKDIRNVALALECIHTYSLIHDDLPAMDDDDYRRGQLTLHKKYDEATAILVGDALISLAFELLAKPSDKIDNECALNLVNKLAKCSGLGGMVGGQILDLKISSSTASIDLVNNMQQMKTGALFHFACLAGPIIKGNDTDQRIFAQFADLFGSIFQISDDLIDIESTLSEAGKNVNKDKEKDKYTLIEFLGVDGAKAKIAQHLEDVRILLHDYGVKSEKIIHLCQELVDRRS
jgi:farnesyl diphosphate synthase